MSLILLFRCQAHLIVLSVACLHLSSWLPQVLVQHSAAMIGVLNQFTSAVAGELRGDGPRAQRVQAHDLLGLPRRRASRPITIELARLVEGV